LCLVLKKVGFCPPHAPHAPLRDGVNRFFPERGFFCGAPAFQAARLPDRMP